MQIEATFLSILFLKPTMYNFISKITFFTMIRKQMQTNKWTKTEFSDLPIKINWAQINPFFKLDARLNIFQIFISRQCSHLESVRIGSNDFCRKNSIRADSKYTNFVPYRLDSWKISFWEVRVGVTWLGSALFILSCYVVFSSPSVLMLTNWICRWSISRTINIHVNVYMHYIIVYILSLSLSLSLR